MGELDIRPSLGICKLQEDTKVISKEFLDAITGEDFFDGRIVKQTDEDDGEVDIFLVCGAEIREGVELIYLVCMTKPHRSLFMLASEFEALMKTSEWADYVKE